MRLPVIPKCNRSVGPSMGASNHFPRLFWLIESTCHKPLCEILGRPTSNHARIANFHCCDFFANNVALN